MPPSLAKVALLHQCSASFSMPPENENKMQSKFPRQAILTLLMLCAVVVIDAQAQESKPAQEILTNDSIIQMTRAGLSSAITINKLRASRTNFDLSIAELMRLKRERVSDAVIQAMQEPTDTPPLASEARRSDSNDRREGPTRKLPNNVPLPEESGIYLIGGSAGQRQLTQLEPSVYSQAKTGGMFKSAMTYGIAKIKTKAVLATPQARLQVNEPRPVFYFYFDVRNSSLSGPAYAFFGPTTSPNEFVLLKMDAKKNTREVIIMQANMFGAQSGTMDKYAHAFDYEKLAPGIYKVTPRSDLPPGEYCFAYASQIAAGFSKVFDFGITRAL